MWNIYLHCTVYRIFIILKKASIMKFKTTHAKRFQYRLKNKVNFTCFFSYTEVCKKYMPGIQKHSNSNPCSVFKEVSFFSFSLVKSRRMLYTYMYVEITWICPNSLDIFTPNPRSTSRTSYRRITCIYCLHWPKIYLKTFATQIFCSACFYCLPKNNS